MSSTTPKYAIPYLVAADAVNTTPTVDKAAADRQDLLLGEAGSFSAVMVANTTLLTPIALARTYPGNTVGTVPGVVLLQLTSPLAMPSTYNWWVTTWTGTTSTITGFTIGLQANASITRTFQWRFIPVL